MSNDKLSGDVWLEHNQAMEPLYADSEQTERRIWFKSKPLTREFCQRVVQLQLCTDSHDQGYASDLSQGAWSWFEIAILPDENSHEPKRTKDDQEMAWKSHSNQLAHEDRTMHYGYMFDRRSELLAHIEVGNVLAVRACVRFSGWANYAEHAFITTRTINEDLFPTDMWTLTSKSLAKHDAQILDCMYTYSATSGCYVKASDASLKSKIWFTTPAFDQDMIDKLESIQLLARSRLHIGPSNNTRDIASLEQSYSWFDIVILDSPTSETPKIINGLSMVWRSHNITSQDFGREATAGQLFDESPLQKPTPVAPMVLEDDANDMGFEQAAYDFTPASVVIEAPDESLLEQWRERAAEIRAIKKSMSPGNAIGVRVCSQFEGGEIYAENGQLAVRISNEYRPASGVDLPDVSLEAEQSALVKQAIMKYQASLECPEGFNTNIEVPEVTMLDHEIRADQMIKLNADVPPPYSESDQRPLRLLSLDGGGVRGVSELRMLDNIMNGMEKLQDKVTNQLRPPHPYEVFDMMAGTSTGGLIAIMLGRLKMSIAECEQAYDEVAKAIFEHKDGNFLTRKLNSAAASFAAGSYMYASEPLIKEIKKLVNARLPQEGGDAQLLSKSDDSGCKVFVVACRANATNDGQQVVQLRSYPTPQSMPPTYTYPKIKIWEAARATSAAPAYFERLRYGDEQFIDGGMVYNNPTPLVLAEVGEVFGYRRPIGCLLSLGTGVPVNLKFSDGVLPIADLIGMLTNSEKAHHLAGPLSKSHMSPGVLKYVRFNLSKALSDSAQFDREAARKPQSAWQWMRGKNKKPKDYVEMIADMDDWKGIARIRELTDDWLACETQAIDDCVKMLQQGIVKPSHSV